MGGSGVTNDPAYCSFLPEMAPGEFQKHIALPTQSGEAMLVGDVALLNSDVSFSPIYDESGDSVDGVMCLFTDSAGRALTNGAEAAGPQYGALFDASGQGFCVAEMLFDEAGRVMDHRILVANAEFKRHTGVTNPTGRLASELVLGGEQNLNDAFGRVATSGQSVRFESGPDVMQRWFDVSVSRIGDANSRKVAVLVTDISERKRAEHALAQCTQQFETLLIHAPFGVYLIGSDFRVRAVNPSAMPTFAGVPNVVGRDFDEVMHILWPSDRADETVQLFRHTLATGEAYYAPDDSEVRKDGGVAENYAWQINRIPLPEGGYGVVCYFHDTSVQHRTRQQIAETEERYRSLFASAPIAVFACDANSIIQTYNALAVELWGREPARGVERYNDSLKLTAPDGTRLSPAQSPMLAVLRTGVSTRNLNGFIDRPDGTSIPVLINIAAQRSVSGEITGSITSFIDISDLVRAEQALQKTQHQLSFVMDSMPQKIFTATPNATIDYLNPQWVEFTGLTKADIRDWSTAGFIHQDDIEHTIAAWTHGFDRGQLIQIEHRFQRADGEYRWHITRALPMRDTSNHITMWVGSSTDIHDQKQTANELQRAALILSETDQRKDEFLAILAHELRNPLAPIRNALRILQLTDGNADAVKVASDIVNRQTNQMIRLVDELLDVSRISRGLIDLRREHVDLAAVVQQAIETNRGALDRAQHELVVTLPENPVYLSADPVRMVQVVDNLLNNAIRYTSSGGCIWLTVERRGHEVRLSVKDTGVGLPEHMLQGVFEMFRQVDQSLERSRGGLGVGLSVVQRLVELHGGSVTAFSKGLELGSEFVVWLPIALDSSAAQFEETTTPSAVQPIARRRILVVDDNEDSANSLAIYLQIVGNETRTAHDGLAAVEAAEAFRPHLVLLDIGLPTLNGYEVARRIRSHPWGQSILLVALSGWGQDGDKRKTSDAGIDQHMVKPVDHEALARIIATLPEE